MANASGQTKPVFGLYMLSETCFEKSRSMERSTEAPPAIDRVQPNLLRVLEMPRSHFSVLHHSDLLLFSSRLGTFRDLSAVNPFGKDFPRSEWFSLRMSLRLASKYQSGIVISGEDANADSVRVVRGLCPSARFRMLLRYMAAPLQSLNGLSE
jgi:hypothetical protein